MSELQRYTKAADQPRMARNAMARQAKTEKEAANEAACCQFSFLGVTGSLVISFARESGARPTAFLDRRLFGFLREEVAQRFGTQGLGPLAVLLIEIH